MTASILSMMGVWFAAAAAATTAIAFVCRDLFLSGEKAHGAQAARLHRKQVYHGALDKGLARLLVMSGSRLNLAWGSLILLGSGMIGAALSLVLTDNLLAAAAGLLLGSVFPLLYWKVLAARRLAAMHRELPETLSVVADCVRSGRGLAESAETASLETKGPLAEELRQTARMIRLGAAPRQALEHLLERAPLPEIRVFAAAMLVHETTGGNLGLLTERLAGAAHDRQAFNDHLSAVSAGSRFSAIGLTIGALTGVAALAYIRPEYMQTLLTHPWGSSILLASAGLFSLGAVWTWRVLRIDY